MVTPEHSMGAPTAEFTIGGVLGKSISLYLRNFIPMAIIVVVSTVVTYGIGIALSYAIWVWTTGSTDFRISTDAVSIENFYWLTMTSAAVIMILASILSYVYMTAAMVSGAVDDLRGNKVALGRCLANGLKVLLPATGVSVVVWLAAIIPLLIAAASMFLFVGIVAVPLTVAAMAAVLWVAVPVVTVERRGVFGSLSRAGDLSRGLRWKIYGTVLVVLALVFVVSIVFGGVFSALTYVTGSVVFEFLSVFVSLLLIGWAAATSAVGYYDLRMAKEGADLDEIITVFD